MIHFFPITAIMLSVFLISPSTTWAADHATAAPRIHEDPSLQNRYHQQRQADYEASCIQLAEQQLGIDPSDVESTQVRFTGFGSLGSEVLLQLRSGRISHAYVKISPPL